MKKKILSIALIAMTLVSLGSFAQNPVSDNSSNIVKERVNGKKTDKDRTRDRNPFEGLTLTEAQQAQLKQLQEKRKTERQQQATERKNDRQRRDSVKNSQRRTARKAYLEEVKAIVGPDQYVIFLENMYVNGGGQNKAVKGKAMRADKGRRDKAPRQTQGHMPKDKTVNNNA